MDEIRKAKRRGDVRTLRKLREGTVTAVVETPDHPETLGEAVDKLMEGVEAGLKDAEFEKVEPTHPEHQE